MFEGSSSHDEDSLQWQNSPCPDQSCSRTKPSESRLPVDVGMGRMVFIRLDISHRPIRGLLLVMFFNAATLPFLARHLPRQN
jgi:hypothetical protein